MVDDRIQFQCVHWQLMILDYYSILMELLFEKRIHSNIKNEHNQLRESVASLYNHIRYEPLLCFVPVYKIIE